MVGEGFKLAVILIIGFMAVSLASLAVLFVGKVDINTLKEFYTGMGTLAAMFGLPGIITAYIVTRGQTAQTQPGTDTSTSSSVSTSTTTTTPPEV